MSRRKILLKFVISMFIIIIGVVFCYYSFQLEKQNYNPTTLKIVFFSLLSIFIILLNVNSILMNKLKNEKIDAEKIENQIFEKKKFSEENYDEYYKHLRKYILYADLYIIAVTLLYSAMYVISCLLFVFFKESFYIGPAIGLLFIIGISISIGKEQPKDIHMGELKEKDFPSLWKLIRKTAKEFTVNKKIYCYIIYDNNSGVIEFDGRIEILLGVQLLHLLNEEELKHILMHEFAHINLNHTSKTKLINKKMEFWHNINVESENLLRGIIRILFYPVLHPLMYHIDVFQMVTSRQKEDEADILVIEKGNNQTHINALAKLNTYDIFTIGELYPVTSIYGPEEIPNNYFELMYQDFLKYYEIYKEKWHELILKRIPARIETHQTFKYRMELAGVLDFQMDFSNKLPEMKKISDYASNIIMNHFKPHYKEERKARYLDHKQLIEEYESNKIDFPKNKLFDLAFAYRILGRIEDAIQIYEELIEEYGERPKYLISKGTAYFSLYDDRGIELVYRAMEKQKKYLKNGIDAISNFCLEMGLQDELDKIREYSKIHRDFIIEELPEVETINLKDKYLPTLLDEDAIAEIINVLAKEERIEKVYISDVIVQMKHKVIAVGVIVKQEHMEKLFDILNNFNEYLYNDRPENYFLMSLDHFPQFIPKFSKIPNSLIYYNK